jgi:hypothetical protein
MAQRRRADDDGRIARLDAAASSALAAVGPDAASQLSALSTLQALSESLPDDGILRELVEAYARERREAFVAFHERCVQRVASSAGSSSSSNESATAAAFAEALALTIGLEGDGEAAAALRALRDQGQVPAPTTAASSSPHRGLPRPFFARFLTHQER